MANNVEIANGNVGNFVIATDDISGVHWPYMKLAFGADNTATIVATGNPLPVTVISGAVTATLSSSAVTVTSGSVTADTELTTADLNTGAGTDTRAVVGIVGTTATGGELIPGTAATGLLTKLATMPAASGVTDGVATGVRTDVLVHQPAGVNTAYVELPVKWATITATAAGYTSVVPAVSGAHIRVTSWDVTTSLAVNFYWASASTALTGLYYADDLWGIAKSDKPTGYFQTAVNEALRINLSGNVPVGGSLSYVEVT